MATVFEYRVNVMNPKTKEIIACDNIPLSAIDNYNYQQREDYLIHVGVEMIKNDSIVRNSDFETIENYVNFLAEEEFDFLDEIYDYIENMPDFTCFVADKVNPETTSKASNPVIMITVISYDNELDEDENEIIGYAVQTYNSTNGNYITQCIYRTYDEAKESTYAKYEFSRIIDISYGQPLT